VPYHPRKKPGPRNAKCRNAVQLPELIDKTILRTGESRATVTGVVRAFLGELQDVASERDAYIAGFGLFESGIRRWHYYDINNDRWGKDVYKITPFIKFTAAAGFIRLVEAARQEEIEAIQQAWKQEDVA
jgi:hypothetical protein